jgi:hypothetical protein
MPRIDQKSPKSWWQSAIGDKIPPWSRNFFNGAWSSCRNGRWTIEISGHGSIPGKPTAPDWHSRVELLKWLHVLGKGFISSKVAYDD